MMKRIIALVSVAVLLAASVPASAQGKYGRDSAECIKYLSFYQQYIKQNNIKEAAPLWRQAISICPPTARQSMLLDGMKILRADINANKNNPIRVKELVDSLKLLHQMRIDNYPKYAAKAYDALSLDLLNYMAQNDPREVFETLDKALDVTGRETHTVIPVRYMDLAHQLYQNGSIDAEKVMACYEKASAVLGDIAASATTEKTKDDAKGALSDVDKIFSASGVASCENLVAIYTPKYEAAPDDKAMLAGMVSALSAQNCVNEDLFRLAVESLHKQEATYNSAYFLFKLYSNINEYDKAVAYMEEAIAYPESDALTDAGYYFEMSQYLYVKAGRNSEAFRAAKAAVEKAGEVDNQELLGKIYFLMAQMWGSVKCGGNEVEVRAPYWVAVDYLVKAKNANPSLAEEANKLIGAFSSYFPAQSEAFMYDIIDGTSYTVECGGMREVTKVRTQK